MAPVIVLLLVLLAAYALLCLFYWAFQERFIFIRFRVGQRYRFRFPRPFEEVFLTAPDGAALHALRFPANPPEGSPGGPRGVVLYFHGNTGSLRRWGSVAPGFTGMGYEVLMPDYRGYGKSRGGLSEAALHADAELWYDHVLRDWKESDIVVYGRSLGSAMATPLAAARGPRTLVLETPFASLRDVARSYLPILPYGLLLRYRFRNDLAIRRVRCPVYILHGKRDAMVPYTSALKLYSMVPATVPREMFTFPRGHHNDLARFPRYGRALRKALGFPAERHGSTVG